LLSLLDERARLLSGIPTGDPGRKPAVDDMLSRHAGPFPARGVNDVFAAVHRHCASFALEPSSATEPESAGGLAP
jgi:hypothetical protein